MVTSQFDQFLQEATTRGAGPDDTLDGDPLYGLYMSWCYVTQAAPRTERSFWQAMKKKQIVPGRNGLRMQGHAAADYILTSHLGLV